MNKNKEVFLSLYDNVQTHENSNLSIESYIDFVRVGTNQDLVLKAREAKQKGDLDFYKQLKQSSKAVTGSCTFVSGVSKNTQNISSLNGLIVIDIDNEQVKPEVKTQLQNDQYTYIMHESFGGGYNYCIFVKIDSNRFEDSFENLAQYYFETYSIVIDKACKNKNRLRFLSYDTSIFVNDKATRWKAYKPKSKEVKAEQTHYVFFEDDFDNILQQINSRGINICSDYTRWVNVGMAIASHFGSMGADKFNFICSFSSKYDPKTNDRHYNGFVRAVANGSNGNTIGIGTFYYYCKEAGIELYSEKTKSIINTVQISKSQGNPTIDSVSSNLRTNGFNVTEDDEDVIQLLIDSKVDYSKLANAELKEIEVLENFILQRYEPQYNEIDQNLYANENTLVDDRIMADIFLTCKKHLDLKKDLTERNVQLIMSSSSVTSFNPIVSFFQEHYKEDCEKGIIEQYAKCIKPYNEYNVWAFKKWLVGAVYNWTCDDEDTDVCPHTMVLTGQEHGIGKTSFIRKMFPKELQKYFKEDRINMKDKDSMFRLGTSLAVLDDEFGGKSVKDDKEFKNVSDKSHITLRRPFQRFDVTVRRRAILAGTTNEIDILKDVTGNRRILPINFEGVDYNRMLEIDKVALLCEAYYELLHGYDWRIRGNDKDYLEKNTKDNVAVIPFEEIFFTHFSLEKSGYFTHEVIVNQGDITTYFNDKNIKITKYDIRDVFIKNKLTSKGKSLNGVKKTGIKVWINHSNSLVNSWDNQYKINNNDEIDF